MNTSELLRELHKRYPHVSFKAHPILGGLPECGRYYRLIVSIATEPTWADLDVGGTDPSAVVHHAAAALSVSAFKLAALDPDEQPLIMSYEVVR